MKCPKPATVSGPVGPSGVARLCSTALSIIFLLLICSLLSACAPVSSPSRQFDTLAALQLPSGLVTVAAVQELPPTPQLLELDREMRAFVALYTRDARGKRQRLRMLHRAVSGRATLGVDYDPFAEGTAREVFHSSQANCLSFANLMVALAREAGLDARYQWVRVRPQWTRMGERVALRLHVNTTVRFGRAQSYMVDIDPLPAPDMTDSRELSDREAQALFHANIAMSALAIENLREAWLQAVRALQLSPGMAHLWVNIGAIYRAAGQHRDAQSSYLYALELDDSDTSAMNNLAVLYRLEGNQERYQYWSSKIDDYRDLSPYYHAWLGDQASEEGKWHGALNHYKTAIKLHPNDSKLLFATGQIYAKLDQPRAALRYIQRAIDNSALRSEQERYRLKYEEVKTRQRANF